MKQIKSGNWKQGSEAEKGFEQQKDALTIHNGIMLSCCYFQSTQSTTLGFDKSV